MHSINSLATAAAFISFFRKKEKQIPLSSWINWREAVLDIYGSEYDPGIIDETINSAKVRVRKLNSTNELEFLVKDLTTQERQETFNIIEFFRIANEDREDYIPGTFNLILFDEIGSLLHLNLQEKETGKEQSKQWLQLNRDDKFNSYILVPSTLKLVLLDFTLRWAFLYLYRTGSLDVFGEIMGIGGTGFFLISQFMIIPLITILVCVFRDKLVVKKTQNLLAKIDNSDIKIKIKNSAWNYLLVVILILQAVLIVSYFDELADPFGLSIIAILFGAYLLVILNYFSKTVPVYKNIVQQIAKKKHRELQNGLNVDENDEEIVTLDVTMKSANEKMNAYIIEAALFGALAFGGFLTLISSADFSVESIELFNTGMRYMFYEIVYFENSAESAANVAFVFSKQGLVVVMCYQSLFCSIFFLSVIASRLRFSVLSDQIDRSLQLSKSYNEKEEVLHAMNQENVESLKLFNEKIRKQLQSGYRMQDQLAPIVEYMKFFRTLGISAFFLIVVTGGMFVSMQLSIVLLFIALLSLIYFRLPALKAQLKSLKIEIQEFYFRINRYTNWISWVLIVISIFMKSFRLPGAPFIMLVGFVVLFLHYIASLFIPVNLKGMVQDDVKTFGHANSFPKLLEYCFKIGLAFFFLGIMFKSFHWPGASLFLILGLVIMIFYFSFTKKIIDGANWLAVVLGIAIVAGLYSYLAKMNHWGGANIIYVFALLSLFISVILTYVYYKKIRPLIRRTVLLLFSVLFLFNFGYPRFVITTFSFNYSAYEFETKMGQFSHLFFDPVENGGLSNATKPEDVEKLKNSLKEFEDFYTTNERLGKDAEGMNGFAWDAFEKSENPLIIEAAVNWSAISISIERNWMYLDTYANLLYKTNRFTEALPIAIEAFEKNGDEESKELVEKIEAKLAP